MHENVSRKLHTIQKGFRMPQFPSVTGGNNNSQDSTQHRSKIFLKKIPGNFLVIQWLGLYASTPWVPSLVEELRSYKQCSAGKKKILKVPKSKI